MLLDDLCKFELAVKSLLFHKAINLLYKAYKDSPGTVLCLTSEAIFPHRWYSSSFNIEYPALPASSELRRRFVQLAETAVDLQQYEIARRCYEVLNDHYALLHIYAICRYGEVEFFPPPSVPNLTWTAGTWRVSNRSPLEMYKTRLSVSPSSPKC